MTEEQLVKALKEGSKTVLGQLYDAYGNALYGTALRMVKNKELAEEVVQDSFVKIWEKRDLFNADKGKLFTWMINILRNTAIDKTRSRDFKSSQKSDQVDDLVYKIDRHHNSEISVDGLGLNDVLKDLPDDQQLILDLVYYKGYTQSEITKEFDIPLGTVKTRLRNALIQLRKVLKVDQ